MLATPARVVHSIELVWTMPAQNDRSASEQDPRLLQRPGRARAVAVSIQETKIASDLRTAAGSASLRDSWCRLTDRVKPQSGPAAHVLAGAVPGSGRLFLVAVFFLFSLILLARVGDAVEDAAD